MITPLNHDPGPLLFTVHSFSAFHFFSCDVRFLSASIDFIYFLTLFIQVLVSLSLPLSLSFRLSGSLLCQSSSLSQTPGTTLPPLFLSFHHSPGLLSLSLCLSVSLCLSLSNSSTLCPCVSCLIRTARTKTKGGGKAGESRPHPVCVTAMFWSALYYTVVQSAPRHRKVESPGCQVSL